MSWPLHVFAETMQVLTWDWVPAALPHVIEHGDNGPAWQSYVSQGGRDGHVVTTGTQFVHMFAGTAWRVSP